jgi:hypothetical protein
VSSLGFFKCFSPPLTRFAASLIPSPSHPPLFPANSPPAALYSPRWTQGGCKKPDAQQSTSCSLLIPMDARRMQKARCPTIRRMGCFDPWATPAKLVVPTSQWLQAGHRDGPPAGSRKTGSIFPQHKDTLSAAQHQRETSGRPAVRLAPGPRTIWIDVLGFRFVRAKF